MAQDGAEIVAAQGLEASDALQNNLELPQLIPVTRIDSTNRLRQSDPAKVEALRASIRRDGLLSPIDVCRLPGKSDWTLVFGGQRFDAVALEGWEYIPAFVRSANALERKSREIAENFFRAELSPIDQAIFVRELIENEKARQGIAGDKDGRVNNVRGGKKEVENDLRILRTSYGLQESVAASLGLTQQEVSRKLALNGIPASYLDRVRALPMAANASALRGLAKLPWAEQAEVIQLIEDGKARNVAEAQAILGNAVLPDAERKRTRTFFDVFARMGNREKLGNLAMLASQMPKGVQIVFEDKALQAAAAAEAGSHLRPKAKADDQDIDEAAE